MKRRDVFRFTATAAALWPLSWPHSAWAQQPGRTYRIGFFSGGVIDGQMSTGPVRTLGLPAFFDELRKLGFSEGSNLVVEYRSSNQPAPQMVAAVTELMRSKLDLIVTTGAESHLRAVLEAHRTIPVVLWANNYDPIERGYVKSLARPGGSVTGVFTRQIDLAEKQLELLTQTFPERTRLGVFWDAQTADQFSAVERRASALKLEMRGVKLQTQPYDFNAAFRELVEGSPQMLQVLSGPAFAQHAGTISELALQHRIPAMYILRNYVDQGGLMSYGVDMRASFRRVASYVARILSGAKPSDLPVEQPTKFELVVNLKTAKAIGLELPTALLLRADEVIE
jgi:putative tryptophan/tyrosine transport system substrate-binding protein